MTSFLCRLAISYHENDLGMCIKSFRALTACSFDLVFHGRHFSLRKHDTVLAVLAKAHLSSVGIPFIGFLLCSVWVFFFFVVLEIEPMPKASWGSTLLPLAFIVSV